MKEYIKGLRENPEDKFLKDKIVYLKKEVKKMNGQRKFKCTACNFEFEVPFGTGQTGDQMNCPSCGAQVTGWITKAAGEAEALEEVKAVVEDVKELASR